MGDRSFIRFGGLAGILLAVTSWAAAVVSYTRASGGEDLVGVEMAQLLRALTAFWALFAVTAVHWVLRARAEAWSFFAVLVGVAAAIASLTASLYPVAFTRNVLRQPIDPAQPLPTTALPTDPLNVMTFGLVAVWFVVADLLLWREGVSRRLAALGFLAAALLTLGLVGALGAREGLVAFAAVGAGVVAVPVYWLWLGLTIRRLA